MYLYENNNLGPLTHTTNGGQTTIYGVVHVVSLMQGYSGDADLELKEYVPCNRGIYLRVSEPGILRWRKYLTLLSGVSL